MMSDPDITSVIELVRTLCFLVSNRVYRAQLQVTNVNILKEHLILYVLGTVSVREFINEASKTNTILRSVDTSATPLQIVPYRMSRDRLLHLYNEVRQFCDFDDRDAVCAKPPPAHPTRRGTVLIHHTNRSLYCTGCVLSTSV